ncbi:fimb protein [Comamonas phosphati]|nr:fimb protein [Comamonas phosphati]
MQNLKIRLRASGIHLGISLCIAALAAVLVFGLWYPYPYREISGGRELFLLVVAVDVVMGPLITLAIFNRAKPRRELLLDFTMVGLLQIAALTYGLWTVFMARPVHLVFEYSRMSVVHAIDLDTNLLSKAPPDLQRLPLTGPTVIALRPFKDSAEQLEATLAALNGGSLSTRTDLWQTYTSATAEILKAAKPATELNARFPQKATQIDQAILATGRPAASLRYLPLLDRKAAWTVLIDAVSVKPLGFLPLDSF